VKISNKRIEKVEREKRRKSIILQRAKIDTNNSKALKEKMEDLIVSRSCKKKTGRKNMFVEQQER
jgi:Spy/CpxP family protein refolding chaperone